MKIALFEYNLQHDSLEEFEKDFNAFPKELKLLTLNKILLIRKQGYFCLQRFYTNN